MTRRRLVRLLPVGLLAGLIISAPVPAPACSLEAWPTSEEILDAVERGEVYGVHVREHIDSTSWLLLRGPRSVSITVKYWGGRPAEPGRQFHGETDWTDRHGCGDLAGPEGTMEYLLTYEGSEWGRNIAVGSAGVGDFEAALTEAFGQPVVSPPDLGTRLLAFTTLWREPAAVLLVVVLFVLAIRRVLRLAREDRIAAESEDMP